MIKSFLLAALFCFADFTLTAQDDAPNRYYVMDYMKVEPGMHDEYLTRARRDLLIASLSQAAPLTPKRGVRVN